MNKIEKNQMFRNGIQVFWTEERKEFTDFSLEELTDMKISARDLIKKSCQSGLTRKTKPLRHRYSPG